MPHPSTAVFAKTEKGKAEVLGRELRLAPGLRALLIMVDGSSDRTQLGRKTGNMPDLSDKLLSLMAAGLVEQKIAASPAPELDEPSPAIQAIPAPPRRKSCALARLYLLDIMERTLGLESEPVRNLLRAATTRDEILATWGQVQPILVETAGAERSAGIEMTFRSQLPEALAA